MSAGYEHELGLFQLGIAERWFTRGEEVMDSMSIVRCNLCHGSKGDAGDDKDVIEHAAPVLRAVTDESICHTRALLRV